MQPGQARTSGLQVPLLLLAQRVGWVAPVRSTRGVWFIAPRPSAALGVFVLQVSGGSWRFFTGARALFVLFAESLATWRLFTGACAVCGTRVLVGSPPPSSFFMHGGSPPKTTQICSTAEFLGGQPLFTAKQREIRA